MTQSPIEQAIEALESVENIPVQSEDSSWRAAAIDKALTALRQHQQDGGWRPIDSAPKDGARVLVFCPPRAVGAKTSKRIRIAAWDGCNWKDAAVVYPIVPTHWRPIPPAPKKENDDE